MLRFVTETTPDGASTILKARFWTEGGVEPDTWDVTYTDSTAALQGISGRVGVWGQTSSGRAAYVDDYILLPLDIADVSETPVALAAGAVSSRHVNLQRTPTTSWATRSSAPPTEPPGRS
jgi:hypothetical protein